MKHHSILATYPMILLLLIFFSLKIILENVGSEHAPPNFALKPNLIKMNF